MKRSLLDALSLANPGMERKALYARVMCGEVLVNGAVERDPKAPVPEGAQLSFRTGGYVSRGGTKLEKALADHQVDPVGKCVLDAGASTGGFTHCLLSHGAACVHAVDVGYNQLDYSLRRRPDVLVHERCNIMSVERLDPFPHFAVADLSFRSMQGAANHILDLVSEGFVLALIKPQFEWSDPRPGFNGVVRSASDLFGILEAVVTRLTADGVAIQSVSESPITGARGNREFFFLLERGVSKQKDVMIGRLRSLIELD